MKKKKLILRLLPWLLLLAALAALVVFVFIPMYTQEEAEHKYEPTVYEYEADDKKLVMKSDSLTFEMDPTNTHFQVTDANGNVWKSNPLATLEEAKKDKVANTDTLKNTLLSTLLVHSRSKGEEKPWSNYQFSIENGNYQIEVVHVKDENGQDTEEISEIRVAYAIGNIEREYTIPYAWTEERYKEFTNQINSKDRRKVVNNYTKYTASKLEKMNETDKDRETLETLLSLYPKLKEQELYVLKLETESTVKETMEKLLSSVGYDEEQMLIDQEWVAQKKANESELFNVTIVYRLEGNDLVVEVPYDQIRYRNKTSAVDSKEIAITGITLLPVFGAGSMEDEGFLFIPEGGGSIINFNQNRVEKDKYESIMYGRDYSQEKLELINETRITFPVFGVAKNGVSFLCMMEGATPFGTIYAESSGVSSSFNAIRARYDVLHSAKYNINDINQETVLMFEKNIPEGSVIHRYRFLDTDNYVEMANAYGDYLRDKEEMLVTASENVPVNVELVGAIDKTVVKMGLPIDSVVATTTFDQAGAILTEMKENGIESLNVRMSGWANGGIYQQVLTSVNVLNELGGESAMKKLIQTAKDSGVTLYFDGISCFAFDSGVLEGFNAFVDAARYLTREQAMLHPYDAVYFKYMEWLEEPFYLVQPQYAQKCTTNLINALDKMDAQGVAFRDIGNLLSADMYDRNTVTRYEVMQMNVESMKEARAKDQKVAIKRGNDYAVPYADLITDMDLTGTKYTVIDKQIPFYQIALHGLKDYTGKPINLAGDYQTEFLKCVEYGSGLNFTFMAENAWVLQDTTHSTLFGSSYDGWKDRFIQMVSDYQANTKGLNQQRIVGHEMVQPDVYVTTYEDGTKVYVNYSAYDVQISEAAEEAVVAEEMAISQETAEEAVVAEETAEEENGVGVVTVPARYYTVERGQ